MFSLFGIDVPPSISFEKDWPDFRLFAIRRHGKQMYGEYPYSLHLAMVEAYLEEHGFSEYHYKAAAWLHDSIEDTKTTLNDINENYGSQVASLVYAVTGEGKTRSKRNESLYKKLLACPEAAPLKVADRLSNTTASATEASHGDSTKLEMYLSEWPEFKANLEPLMQDERRKQVLFWCLSEAVERARDALENVKAKADSKDEEKGGEVSPTA